MLRTLGLVALEVSVTLGALQAPMVKLRVTDEAAAYELFPLWLALIVHTPAIKKVATLPLTLHTVVVRLENVTANPDDAVAVNVAEFSVKRALGGLVNVID